MLARVSTSGDCNTSFCVSDLKWLTSLSTGWLFKTERPNTDTAPGTKQAINKSMLTNPESIPSSHKTCYQHREWQDQPPVTWLLPLQSQDLQPPCLQHSFPIWPSAAHGFWPHHSLVQNCYSLPITRLISTLTLFSSINKATQSPNYLLFFLHCSSCHSPLKTAFPHSASLNSTSIQR